MRKIIAALALLVSFWYCQAQETEFSKNIETKFKDKDNKEIKFSQILDKYKGKTIH